MNWIQENTQVIQSETQGIFYRGHANEKYKLEPSVYRKNHEGKSYRDVEYQIYQDMLHRNPVAFTEDKTVFEKLVRMQHHGLPTRLLDLTQSPLVALFFACNKEEDKNGEVMLFSPLHSNIIYPQAIPEPALAGLEVQLKLSNLGHKVIESLQFFFEDENKLISEHEEFNKNYHEILSTLIQAITEIKLLKDLLLIIIKLKFIEECIDSFFKNWDDNLNVQHQDSKNETQRSLILTSRLFLMNFKIRYSERTKKIITDLCKQIHIQDNQEWHYLDIFLQSFTFFNFVYPPLNNERIRRQQGTFLICPPIHTDFWTIDQYHKPAITVIKAESKKKILADLANLGITESYLFPELEQQAKDILLRYKLG
jgi:hypothetical protein